ncbi:MAG: two-component system response regulator, partial [Faecalibacillus sp.]
MKMNLLLVEDAKIYLILFQQYFEKDFNVVSAINVDDAKSIIKDNDFQFDVILLDLMTRGAMRLLAQIKKAKRLAHVPVIVITASDDDKDKIQAF